MRDAWVRRGSSSATKTGGADMARAYKPTHVQRMRAGAAFKSAVRGEVVPVRRVTGGAR